MRSSLKKLICYLAPRLMLGVLPPLILYLCAEFLVFKPLIPYLPLRYIQRLPEPLQMLSQRSKKRTMPHDYVLILGDSFAAGWGDWLETSDPGKNAPYGTHDLLHAITGRDVVHSGFAGGAPIETLVRKPVNRFRYLRKMWFYHPEDPEHILWYFYEGNDLFDNIERIRDSQIFKGKVDESRLRDRAYFKNFLETEVVKFDKLYWEVRKFHKRPYYQLPAFLTLQEIAANLFNKGRHQSGKPPAAKPGTNIFRKGSGTECIKRGDVLCPPTHLFPEDRDLSLYMTGESIDFLRQFFPKSKFTIIYVPSVATSYPVVSEKMTVQRQNQNDPIVANTRELFAASDETFAGVNELAKARGIQVIDARPALQEAASRLGLIHGPLDFYHLNKQGYEVLARLIAAQVYLTKKVK